jgi:hypothetical protein
MNLPCVQYHNDMAARKKAASLGLPMMEFDAAAEFWAKDMDTILSVYEDPDYLRIIVPDEEKFLTREASKFMVGYERLHLDRTSAPQVSQSLSLPDVLD